MKEIFHYFRLHSFNLKAIAAGDSLEFFWARGSAHLHQPLLKLFNAIMGRLEFLLACYHISAFCFCSSPVERIFKTDQFAHKGIVAGVGVAAFQLEQII